MGLRRFLRCGARMLIAALLFAQGTLALAACDWARRAPALAVAQPGQGSGGCMEQMQNVNLCVAHCLGEDQSADTPQVVVPAWNMAPPLLVAVINRTVAREAILRHALPYAGAPPPRILFHSFLI